MTSGQIVGKMHTQKLLMYHSSRAGVVDVVLRVADPARRVAPPKRLPLALPLRLDPALRRAAQVPGRGDDLLRELLGLLWEDHLEEPEVDHVHVLGESREEPLLEQL